MKESFRLSVEGFWAQISLELCHNRVFYKIVVRPLSVIPDVDVCYVELRAVRRRKQETLVHNERMPILVMYRSTAWEILVGRERISQLKSIQHLRDLRFADEERGSHLEKIVQTIPVALDKNIR